MVFGCVGFFYCLEVSRRKDVGPNCWDDVSDKKRDEQQAGTENGQRAGQPSPAPPALSDLVGSV